MGKVFKINRVLPYNLRTHNEFSSGVPKTVKCGTETFYFLAPKVWVLVPGKIKECSCLEAFKSKIRKWKPDCTCRLRKTYLQHVGFFKYPHIYTSVQMLIVTIIFHSEEILFIQMIHFRCRCDICIKQ